MVVRPASTGLTTVAPLRIGADGTERTVERRVPDEVPVALVYDGATYAVMLATPTDLEAFAVGFSLSERIVPSHRAIEGIEIVDGDLGVEARLWLAPGAGAALAQRRRALTGPTGCGLCGVESLAAALPELAPVTAEISLGPADVLRGIEALGAAQGLNRVASALHGAGFWVPGTGLVASAEDVGRHNALDKLIGRLALGDDTRPGAVIVTSRVSVELVHKCAVLGSSVLIAFSAPTALAIERADRLGVTLVAVARADGFEVFTHVDRIDRTVAADQGIVVHAA